MLDARTIEDEPKCIPNIWLRANSINLFRGLENWLYKIPRSTMINPTSTR